MTLRFVPLLLLPLLVSAADSPFRDLFFEPNRGQVEQPVRYIARAHGANLAWTEDCILLQLGSENTSIAKLRFPGANPNAKWEALDEAPGTSSYFIGSDKTNYARDVPHFKRLARRGIYPGIDLIFYGRNGHLEYDFVVAPGADPKHIRMSVDAPASLSLARAGDLKIKSGSSSFDLKRPIVYQDGGHTIHASYKLESNRRIKFDLARYDRKRPLVIDPVLSFSSYIGGENDDSVVAVTDLGDIIGVTRSLSFGPGIARRGRDIFAMLPSPYPGGRLLFFGGSGDDVPTCATADANTLVIGGWTNSKDFVNTTPLGGTDGFLLAIDHRYNAPFVYPWAVIVGGSGDDRINAITGTGTTLFAGETNSPDLAVAPGTALSTQLAGGTDAILGRAYTSANGVNLADLAYFGGSRNDRANAIAQDTQGRIILGGQTSSPDLPLQDPLSTQLNGPSDAFLSLFTWKFGQTPVPDFSTYFGGSGEDEIRAISLSSDYQNPNRTLFFAGTTGSKDLKLVNSAQPLFGGGDTDAFAGRLDLIARQIIFSTYIGGSGNEEGNAIVAGPFFRYNNLLSQPVVAGSTTSQDLRVMNPVQEALNGPQDAFLASFDPEGTLQSLTYFGGSGSERGLALIVSADNIATIAGETNSTDLPTPARNLAPTVYSGGLDGFVAGIPLTAFVNTADSSGYWTGKDLVTSASVYLSSNIPAGALLTVTSSDPSLVQVSFDQSRPPAATQSVPIAVLGRPYAGFVLTGLADSGEATVTVSLQGFGAKQIRVRLGSPVVRTYSSASDIVYAGKQIFVFASLGVTDDQGIFHPVYSKTGADPIVVDFTVTDPSLGSLDKTHYIINSQASVLFFTASSAGQELITATSSGPPIANPSGIAFRIVTPTFRIIDFVAGKHLDTSVQLSLDSPLSTFEDNLIISSDDPSRLCLVLDTDCKGTITVPASSRYFQARALADSGLVHLHYSSSHSGEGTATVQLARPKLNYSLPSPVVLLGSATPLPLYFTAGNNNNRIYSLEPGYAQKLNITSADPKIASVAIGPQGPTVTGLAPGQTVVTVSAPDFDNPLSIALTVTAPAISFSANTSADGNIVIGKDLQTYLNLSLPSQTSASVKSSDPSRLLVSNDSSTPGTGQITYRANVSLQALSSSGSAYVTVSVEGLADLVIPVALVPSGFTWNTGALAVTSYTNTNLPLTTYALDPVRGIPLIAQSIRPGITKVPGIASSNPSAGTYTFSAQSADFTFAAGAPGSTVLTIIQPDDMTAPSIRNSTQLIVNPAILSGPVPFFLGRDLQTSFTPQLTNNQTKLPITIQSSDTSRLLVSTSKTAMGLAQVDVNTGDTVFLQGLTSEGVAELRLSGAGIDLTVYPVTLTPSGIMLAADTNVNFQGPLTLTTFSPDLIIQASLFANAPLLSSVGASLRPGATPLQVPVTSSQPKILRVATPSVTFTPGGPGSANVTVSPLNEGVSIVSLSPPPSFHTDSQQEQLAVKVTLPSFIPKNISVARDFLAQTDLQLALTLPSTIIVTLTSNDPSHVLLSTRPDQIGQPRVSVAYGSGSGTFYVHGIAEGATTITASATGFADTVFKAVVVQPTISLSGPATAIIGKNDQAYFNFPGQGLRPGASVSITLRSSNPAVATVESPVTITNGSQQSTALITPVSSGATTISADLPDGWALAGAALSFNLSVSLPPLPINNTFTSRYIGRNLQVGMGLTQTAQGPLTLTITSDDPSKVLISKDAKTIGQGSASFAMTYYSQANIFIQAIGDTGTATLTYSISGFKPQQQTINLVPASILFDANLLNTTTTMPLMAGLSAIALTPQSQNYERQALGAGHAPLSIAVNSSQPSVGTVKRAATLNPGDASTTLTFTPIATGTTNLTITQPDGFVSPPAKPTLVISVN